MLQVEAVRLAATGGGGSLSSLLFPLLLIALLLLFLTAQRRRQRAVRQTQASLEVGARVMTTAGLFATVAAVEGDEVLLEVAPGVVCRYVRAAVARVVPPPAEELPPDDAASQDRPGG